MLHKGVCCDYGTESANTSHPTKTPQLTSFQTVTEDDTRRQSVARLRQRVVCAGEKLVTLGAIIHDTLTYFF